MITTLIIVIGVIVLIFGLVVVRGAPYVPSHSYEIKQAFTTLYKLKAHDTVVDIGSGDGIVLRHAARFGAHAIGYEINPILVVLSWLLALRSSLIRVELADFWYKELPEETTVVYAFSVSRDADKLAKKMQRETNRVGKPLDLITYGAPLNDKTAIKKHRGHRLYRFTPLQDAKA